MKEVVWVLGLTGAIAVLSGMAQLMANAGYPRLGRQLAFAVAVVLGLHALPIIGTIAALLSYPAGIAIHYLMRPATVPPADQPIPEARSTLADNAITSAVVPSKSTKETAAVVLANLQANIQSIRNHTKRR